MCDWSSVPSFCFDGGPYFLSHFFHPCSFPCLASFHPWKFGSVRVRLWWKCGVGYGWTIGISESSLSAVMVLSLKGAYGRSACGCCNSYISYNAARVAVLDDDTLGIWIVLGCILLCHTLMLLMFLLHKISSTCDGEVLVQYTIQVCHVLPIWCTYLVVQRLLLLFQVRLMALYCNQSFHWDVPQLIAVGFCGSYGVGWLLCMPVGWFYSTGVMESPDRFRPGWR